MIFTDQMRQVADPIWVAQHEHPFVRGIGKGNLESSKFQHYVRQDYLFLIDYARLLALGCGRAPQLDAMARFAQLTSAVLGTELELHRGYAAEWGVSTVELEDERPTATTRAYSDFLLRIATLGDYGELVAALLPCMWGYHEIATHLAKRGRPSNELYARWIEEYAGAEFGELASWCRALTDEAAKTADTGRMTDAFVTSSHYELAFWDASWREEPPLR